MAIFSIQKSMQSSFHVNLLWSRCDLFGVWRRSSSRSIFMDKFSAWVREDEASDRATLNGYVDASLEALKNNMGMNEDPLTSQIALSESIACRSWSSSRSSLVWRWLLMCNSLQLGQDELRLIVRYRSSHIVTSCTRIARGSACRIWPKVCHTMPASRFSSSNGIIEARYGLDTASPVSSSVQFLIF